MKDREIDPYHHFQNFSTSFNPDINHYEFRWTHPTTKKTFKFSFNAAHGWCLYEEPWSRLALYHNINSENLLSKVIEEFMK